MTAPEPSAINPAAIDQAELEAVEAQLQQELKGMFILDTQQHLQTYVEVVQQLNSE
ncbi:MAG: hypothetical protein AAGB01_06885 [Cyanobacteria bacterium P01_F01_bin.42]